MIIPSIQMNQFYSEATYKVRSKVVPTRAFQIQYCIQYCTERTKQADPCVPAREHYDHFGASAAPNRCCTRNDLQVMKGFPFVTLWRGRVFSPGSGDSWPARNVCVGLTGVCSEVQSFVIDHHALFSVFLRYFAWSLCCASQAAGAVYMCSIYLWMVRLR
jgi:hypothetical protein